MNRNKALASLIAALIFTISNAFSQQDLAKLKEYQSRGGLPYFSYKVQSGKPIKVAFLGGSITLAEDGWRSRMMEWLEKEWPLNSFEEVNACLGGTGSDLAVFRLEQDIFPHKPDLIFVEFAVNDAKKSPEKIKKAMEGIVLKSWQFNIASDFCFVYTVNEDMIDTLQAGNMQQSASAMEEVADFYNIPSIHLGVSVLEKMDKDGWTFTGDNGDKSFTRDGLHPHVTSGHKVYFETISEIVLNQVDKDKLKPHKVKKTISEDNWSNARILAKEDLTFSEGWQSLTELNRPSVTTNEILPEVVMKSKSTGETIDFKFTGSVLGIYDIVGPSAGTISISIDGGEPQELTRFDPWCTYNRLSYLLIEGLEKKEHTAQIKVLDKELDKEAILKERGNEMGNPALFKENALSLVGILVAD
ncbi:hypothetical protein R9C00_10935 [Flammeovirgaceae bacterium SG7u.111]|nr:hypothetical protein [Flammeovirgaceae bacterium SG7u.132]WPO37965.1 hypothetical protein R9C00_10935 [Flammeovirgaceae bacterium SG7u.111]